MRLLLAVLLVGCAHDSEPEPTAPPKELVQLAATPPAVKPAPPPAAHTQIVRAQSWGMAGSGEVEVDLDARTVRVKEDIMSKPKVDRTRKLTDAELADIVRLATPVWTDPPPSKEAADHANNITDVREDLTLIDGDKRWYRSEAMITYDETSAATLYEAVEKLRNPPAPRHEIHITADTIGGPELADIDLDAHTLHTDIAGHEATRKLADADVAALAKLAAAVWKEAESDGPEQPVRCSDCEVKLVLVDGAREWHRTDAPTKDGTARLRLEQAVWKLAQ